MPPRRLALQRPASLPIAPLRQPQTDTAVHLIFSSLVFCYLFTLHGLCFTLSNYGSDSSFSIHIGEIILRKISKCFCQVEPTPCTLLTNVATASSTAESGFFTNCTTETTPKKIIRIALIKPTDTAAHLIFWSLAFCYFERVKNNTCNTNKLTV